MQFYVCLRNLDKLPDPILQVVKQDSWENREGYVAVSPETDALKEFSKKVREMRSIPTNVDVFITWFGIEEDKKFEFPQEFLGLVSQHSFRVIFSLIL